MKRLAIYHLAWAVALAIVTGVVFSYALKQWLATGQPPIYHFWFQQLVIVCGAYRTWYHTKAFNASLRKVHG